MIRIFKCSESPQSLSRQTSWTGEDVIAQLRSDQYQKCYICERVRDTDFQVEHHKSREKHPDLTYEWTNLYWSCGYCNGKKSSLFDNLLSPIDANIEELIYQAFDFPNSKAIFTETLAHSDNVETTIRLLCRIFNGTNRLRTIREQQFYNSAMAVITKFQEMVISWLGNPNDEIFNAIVEELDIRSEFLGFKYWIIKSNDKLNDTFGRYIIWHKA